MDEYPNTREATFAEWFDYIDVAALVHVNAVKKAGELVKVSLREIYKGTVPEKFKFGVSMSWMPDEWFVKNEVSVVFLKRLNDQSLNAFGYNARIKIEGEVAQCFDCPETFWQPELLLDYNEEFRKAKVDWNMLASVLREGRCD